MVGMGQDGFVWGEGWICQEQRSLLKVLPNGRREEQNGQGKDKEPHGPGVSVGYMEESL